MWEAWQTRKATKRPTSRLLKPSLIDEFGADWEFIASDIDQAVFEWGQFIEGKVEERTHRYYREVDRANSRRIRESKGKTTPYHEEYSTERVQEIYQEAIRYWVHGRVREYTDIPGDDVMSPGGRAYQEKPATWDPAVDASPDWDTDDVEVVYLDRPGSSGPPEAEDDDEGEGAVDAV